MRRYWNNPPGWPQPPAGWMPPPGWAPPPDWPPPPAGWVFVIEVDDDPPMLPPTAWSQQLARPARRRGWAWSLLAAAVALALLSGLALRSMPDRGGPVERSPAAAPQAPTPLPTADPSVPAVASPTAPARPAPAISVQPLPSPTVEVRTQSAAPAPPPGFPPAGVAEQARRLLPVVPFNGNPTWSAMTTNPDGSPAGFSPCRPWRVVVNLDGAPPGAYDTVAGVVATVTAATGVVFELEGTTDEPVNTEATRRAYQPERYGERWAPILIGWAPSTEENAAGQGGPQGVTMTEGGTTYYVTGFVAIDPEGASNQDPVTLRAILLHEFAHVVGLNHVDDPTQLMAPVYQGQREFQTGDLAGLAAVGAAHCSPDV